MNRTLYHYQAYGLRFSSEVAFHNMQPHVGADKPDVSVCLGSVPPSLENLLADVGYAQWAEHQFRLVVDDVADFLVSAGNEIRIEPHTPLDWTGICDWVLSWCMGAILHQRNILPLHAAAIDSAHGAILFLGESGIGKSTLLNAFLQRGYPMFTDDLVGVQLDTNRQPLVLPGLPRTKLWQDAVETLTRDTTAATHIWPYNGKYLFTQRQQLSQQPKRLHRIYWLNKAAQTNIQIDPLPKQNIFEVVMKNVYRPNFLRRQSQRQINFAQASAIVQSADLFRVTRPATLYRLTELTDAVEQHAQCQPPSK